HVNHYPMSLWQEYIMEYCCIEPGMIWRHFLAKRVVNCVLVTRGTHPTILSSAQTSFEQ
ncbi:hypothetical protein MKW92_042153, partial [Papaver armeniacum]